MDTLASLEARILRAGKTIKQLLAEADIDPSLWWKWQRGRVHMRPSSLRRLNLAADKLAPRRGR